jgi:hypothetical protein
MALVFISHSHSDKLLARELCSLLRDALALGPEDFFMSSETGRGVAPAANIQDAVFAALSTAPVLIVVLTPQSVLSRWIWLEAGNRLGKSNAANPLWVCPSERFASLLGPFSQTKALSLDNDGELVELVAAVASGLGRAPREYLSYRPAIEDLVALAKREYSPGRERRQKIVSWAARHAVALLIGPLLLVAGWWLGGLPLETAIDDAAIEAANSQNEQLAAVAARYLILNGTVYSQDGTTPIADALVLASRNQTVRDEAGCQEPECTFGKTYTRGQFSIDLTRIKAKEEDRVTLTVVKEGFQIYSELLRVDVRAMNADVAPQAVKLSPATMIITPGTSQ